jgi:hypothetical protein
MLPKYRVTERSFINNSLVEEGATVEYDGVPGPNLEPINNEAIAAKEEAAKGLGTRNVSVGDMTRQKVAVIGGDPEAVEPRRPQAPPAPPQLLRCKGRRCRWTASRSSGPAGTPAAPAAPAAPRGWSEGAG